MSQVGEKIQNLKTVLVDLYDLSEEFELEETALGVTAANHIVHFSNGHKIFLKQYPFFEEPRILSITNMCNLMEASGIPVVSPITDKLGQKWFSLEGKYYAAYPFIGGLSVEHFNSHSNNTEKRLEVVKHAASVLARIHNLAMPDSKEMFLRKNYNSEKAESKVLPQLEQVEKIIKNLPDESRTEIDLISLDAIKSQRELITSGIVKKFDWGFNSLVHGDFHLENLLFESDGSIKAVLDWDNSGIGNWQCDLAYGIFCCCSRGLALEEISLEEMHLFLKSYVQNSNRKISSEDVEQGIFHNFRRNLNSTWALNERYLYGSSKVDKFIRGRIAFFNQVKENLGFYIRELISVL